MNTPLWKCSTALIKLQKPLSNVDGRKIPPFPGQPCPSSCSPVRAERGIPGLECSWEKQRDDPATEKRVFPSFFFPSVPSWKASCLPARKSHKETAASSPAVPGNVSNSSRGGQGQLEQRFDMGQWPGRAACYHFFWLNKSGENF